MWAIRWACRQPPGGKDTGQWSKCYRQTPEAGRARDGPREDTGQRLRAGRTGHYIWAPESRCALPTTLTLHHTPRVLPCSDQLVPHLHLLGAAHHSKGQVCLERSPRMAQHWADKLVDRPCPGPQGGVARPEQGLARAHFLALQKEKYPRASK